jgi:hypothetical protein
MRVRLETGPKHELVTYGDLPDFTTEPEVVIWGNRVFTYNPASPNDNAYSEAFACVLIQDQISDRDQ